MPPSHFDLEAGAHFHRDLPYDLTQVEALHPRLLAARKLVPEVRWEGVRAAVIDGDVPRVVALLHGLPELAWMPPAAGDENCGTVEKRHSRRRFRI